MNDSQLQQNVIDELGFRPDIDASHIGVTVADGVVTLTGHLPSYAQKYETEQAVKSVDGVRGLVEHLTVNYGTQDPLGDEEIAKRALSSLKWNAIIPPKSVTVTVNKGWVTLSGQVHWQFERNSAESAVRGLLGVVGVTNELRLKSQPQPADVKTRIEQALKRSAEIDSDDIRVKVANGTVTLEGTVDSWRAREQAESAAWSAPGVREVADQLTVI